MSYTNPPDPQETALIARASKMDLEAFNQLVLKYQDLIYNLSYALLDDHHAAEDATQETFIKAFKNMHRFRGGAFRPWLAKIATNTCFDELRKTKRYTQTALYAGNEYGEEQDSPAWIADPSPAIQSVVEHKELTHNLYRLVGELPPEYRNALTLIDIYEMDYAETARALNIPLGTLKSRVARARLLVRNWLSNHYTSPAGPLMLNPSSICA